MVTFAYFLLAGIILCFYIMIKTLSIKTGEAKFIPMYMVFVILFLMGVLMNILIATEPYHVVYKTGMNI